jgi:ubiquinol-cytochrome c reductase cytochrome c subunit
MAVNSAASLFACVFVLLAHQSYGRAQTGDSPPPASPAASTEAQGDAARGKTLFVRYSCYACHGYEGHSGPGGRLVPVRFPLAAFQSFVRNPPTMPPYTGKVLTDAQLADIWAFLKSIPPSPPASSIALLQER